MERHLYWNPLPVPSYSADLRNRVRDWIVTGTTTVLLMNTGLTMVDYSPEKAGVGRSNSTPGHHQLCGSELSSRGGRLEGDN